MLGTFDDALLPEPVDRILMVNTYHHISDRPAYFRRLLPFVRADGRVAIVDFRMGQIPVGPPEHRRIESEQVTLKYQGRKATVQLDRSRKKPAGGDGKRNNRRRNQ